MHAQVHTYIKNNARLFDMNISIKHEHDHLCFFFCSCRKPLCTEYQGKRHSRVLQHKWQWRLSPNVHARDKEWDPRDLYGPTQQWTTIAKPHDSCIVPSWGQVFLLFNFIQFKWKDVKSDSDGSPVICGGQNQWLGGGLPGFNKCLKNDVNSDTWTEIGTTLYHGWEWFRNKSVVWIRDCQTLISIIVPGEHGILTQQLVWSSQVVIKTNLVLKLLSTMECPFKISPLSQRHCMQVALWSSTLVKHFTWVALTVSI